jgi:hypothetical protein
MSNETLGDGIPAYFGFPRAHEDDAEARGVGGARHCRSRGRLQAPEGPRRGRDRTNGCRQPGRPGRVP